MCNEGCTERLKAITYVDKERDQRDPMESEIASLKIGGIPVTTGF